MNLTVNGTTHDVESHGLRPLLHVLREELGITSPKAGCQQGGCGTCTVLVDGTPRRSCLLPLAALDGAAITTVEGIGTPEHLGPVQAAFHEHYGSQCGFCTPGMLLAAQALIELSAAASVLVVGSSSHPPTQMTPSAPRRASLSAAPPAPWSWCRMPRSLPSTLPGRAPPAVTRWR